MRARLAMLPALGAAAIVPAPGTIFSVAGTTGPPRATSSIATATRLRLPGSLDALPDGGFVVADGWRVLRVYPTGGSRRCCTRPGHESRRILATSRRRSSASRRRRSRRRRTAPCW
jgi:hypothetical protein